MYKKLFLTIITLLLTSNLCANYTKNKSVINIAKNELNSLIKKGRIAKSWRNADLSKFEQKLISKNFQYVTAFTNKTIKNFKRNTLHFVINKKGEVSAISYSYKELF